MSTPFRLSVPRYFHNEIVSQAQTELPNECCGLLAGRMEINDSGIMARVTRRFPLVNAAASPCQFDSEPRSMFEAHKALRRQQLDILAIYHSHPTSAPVPSATDLERSYSPDVINLIVSLEEYAPKVRGWWFGTSGYVEADVEWVDG